MIRRRWIIYNRKTKQTVSVVFHSRKWMKSALNSLNDYCGYKKYGAQLVKINTKKNKVVSVFPNIELKPFPKQIADCKPASQAG